MKGKEKRKFFWLVIFLFVFASYTAAAVEITQVGKTVTPHPNTNQEFLVLISENFWQVPEVQEAIERYQDDVYKHRQVGSRVFMVSPAELPFGPGNGCGGDIESSKEIREFLKSQYYDENPARLVGVILVGDLPWVNVMILNNYIFGVCDTYFGELNFEGWTIVNQQECHYLEIPYCAGGCIHPEIWVSRVIPPVCFDFFLGRCDYPKGGFSFSERVEMLLRFFEKDHWYWIKGNDYHYHNFLAVDPVSEEGVCWGINGFPVEKDDDVICENKINKEKFFDYLKSSFRMVDFLMHGGYNGASLGVDFFVTQEIFKSEIRIPVILVNTCSGARFDYQNSLSEAYLFGENSEVISVIGLGTSTYPLEVPFSLRYDYIGKAFKEVKCWGQDEPQAFVIIEGDPFVKVVRDLGFHSHSVIYYELSSDLKFSSLKFSSRFSEARPLIVSRNGDWVELKLGFTGFREPVDIYVGVDARPLGFFIWTQNGIVLWDRNMSSSSLIPYKRQWVNGFEEVVYAGNVTDLPEGDYYGYVLVVPSGTDMNSFSFESSADYYLWYWRWTHTH